MEKKVKSIAAIIGSGYDDFWRCKKRYRVVKGGKASKKSTTTALWIIANMMKPQYAAANTLVVRKVFTTHRESTFAQLGVRSRCSACRICGAKAFRRLK